MEHSLVDIEPPRTIANDEVVLDDGIIDDDESIYQSTMTSDPIHESATTSEPASDEWKWQPSAMIEDPRTRSPVWGMDLRRLGRFIDPVLGRASPDQLFVAFLPREYIERTKPI